MAQYPILIRLHYCFLALLLLQTSFGQDDPAYQRPGTSIKPTTDFDQRFYYVAGERQNVWGYRAGMVINDKYKLGIGGYYMSRQTEEGSTTPMLNRSTPSVVTRRLYLGSIYYEPYLLRRPLWESSLVFETGYGRTVNTVIDKFSTSTIQTQNGLLIPAGIGLSVNIKMPPFFQFACFRWVGVNAMAGYRTSIYRQDKHYDIAGAYWSLSGAIFLDKIFDDYHAWKKQRVLTANSRHVQLSF